MLLTHGAGHKYHAAAGTCAPHQLSHAFASCRRSPHMHAASVEPAPVAWDQDEELQAVVAYMPGRAQSAEEGKAIGCLLGAMCGNALGAPVQNDRHWQVTMSLGCSAPSLACHDSVHRLCTASRAHWRAHTPALHLHYNTCAYLSQASTLTMKWLRYRQCDSYAAMAWHTACTFLPHASCITCLLATPSSTGGVPNMHADHSAVSIRLDRASISGLVSAASEAWGGHR